MKKKIIIFIIILILSSIFLLIYYYSVRTRNTVEALIRDKMMINILIAGSNRYNDNRHKFFAIISINPENKRIGITFIPPSFKIRLDDRGSIIARIDEVGLFDFKKIQYSLKEDLKLNIPFYIELYSPDLERIVDLTEGIDLFVLDQIKNLSDIKFGINYFDGQKIVRYINSVDENSIYIKFDRIQDIIMTLYCNRESLELYNNIEFIAEMFKSIKTNLLPQEIYKLGEVIFSDGDIMATMLPGGFKDGYYMVDDIAYKIYEKEFLTSLVINKEIESAIKIKILNGTNVPGLARRMRRHLTREGMNVVEFGTSSFKKMKKSIIISRKGNFSAVNRVAELTGITNIYNIIDNTQLYSVLIIIGEDLAN